MGSSRSPPAAAGPIRLFPSPRPSKITSTPLSILDATCARFADTSAIWLYHAPTDRTVDDDFVEGLRTAFVTTLGAFPQWAGQLHWAAPYRHDGHHTERYNRSVITYGGAADPGAEWAVVRHAYDLASIIPTAEHLSSADSGVWDGNAFPQKDLVSAKRVALSNLRDCAGVPAMMVQINLFACGGYGVGVKLAHQLADASSMMVFVHAWTANAQHLFQRSQQEQSSVSLFGEPVFEPSLLDARAAGIIDGKAFDEEVAQTAREMPLHRFSWWDIDEPGYSPWLVASTKNCIPPADFLFETKLSPSTVGAWKSWDPTRPVSWGLLHFTGQDMLRFQQVARESTATTSTTDPAGIVISRTDALMAYLFRLITRARSFAQGDDDEVFLNVSIDARRRVSPPLPDTFLGSPLLMTHIKGLASAIRDTPLGELALRLRQTLVAFTPDKMAAILHDAAYEVSPQRLWLGFIGSLHLIATSWQRLQVYEVDFEGSGRRPVYVHAVMEKCDGTFVVMDPLVLDGGVDIALYLDAEALGHVKEELARDRAG